MKSVTQPTKQPNSHRSSKHNKLIVELFRYKIILFDKTRTYKLKNGGETCMYIDFRKAISFPHIQEDLCALYCDYITRDFADEYDYIVGVPDGAVPMAAQISARLSKPLLMMRKEVKQHGLGNLIEGHYISGKKVLIIEDVVTTGGSCVDTVGKLRSVGLIPIEIICLLKRTRIPLGKIFAGSLHKGIVPIHSLFDMGDIEFQIKLSASKLCIAADVTTMGKLEHIIIKASPFVSIIKTHIDIISDFDPHESIARLQHLKNKYGVLLWEDRKFADIPVVTSQQITNGVHKIAEWADIVSIHTISGPEVFCSRGCKNYTGGCKIIAIAQMSTHGALTDNEYLDKSLKMLDPLADGVLDIQPDRRSESVFKNVIGIVTQTPLKTNLLTFVPGVHHAAGVGGIGDGKGQCYRSPMEVQWADIIVVGRGLTENIDTDDFETICKKYIE